VGLGDEENLIEESMRQERIANHSVLNRIHTVLLFGAMLLVLGALGFSLGGISGLLWGGVLALPTLLLGQRISPRWLLRMYGARPLAAYEAPALYSTVRALSEQAGLPAPPQLYYVPNRTMNAFSVGTRDDPALGVTDGLLRTLSPRELSGVMAHEITHIRQNDLRVLTLAGLIGRMTGLLSTIGQFLLFLNLPLLLMGRTPISWLAVVLLLVAPSVSGLLRLALARTRELDADLGAARLSGDPLGLASALRKMECYGAGWLDRMLRPYRTSSRSLLRTHPETEERVERLLDLARQEHRGASDDLDGLFACPGNLA
jgi:heat shock protein HtpX